jgi:nitroreductase
VLVEGNQRWVKDVPVLMISVASLSWSRNGKSNRHALHDVGLATENLLLQATALGLQAHPMAGFDMAKARETYTIPEGYEPVAAIAVGYPTDPATLSDEVRQKELSPRVRKPQDEFVFAGNWGQAMK